jgi:hypothetical protein
MIGLAPGQKGAESDGLDIPHSNKGVRGDPAIFERAFEPIQLRAFIGHRLRILQIS